MGYDFAVFTTDQYQSQTSITYLEKLMIRSFIYSMDRSDEPWEYGKQKFLSGAVEMYYYSRFEFELFSLIHDRAGGKVDHPPQNGIHAKDGGYGNDISSCVFGTLNHIFNYGRSQEERDQSRREILQMHRSMGPTSVIFKSERDVVNFEERTIKKRFNYEENADPFMRKAKADRLKLFGRKVPGKTPPTE
jgi:hypothetical protein